MNITVVFPIQTDFRTMIRCASQPDAERIAEIYNYFIEQTYVTFEETPVSANEMWQRISQVTSSGYPWYVFDDRLNGIAGYAYAAQWKNRSAYRFAAEVTVYLDPISTGRGIGTHLYASLLDTLKEKKIHRVMGGIALPNDQSVALHEKLGFTKVAHFKELGWKQNRWIDVGYWQLNLDESAVDAATED